jgi:hypothetical protein
MVVTALDSVPIKPSQPLKGIRINVSIRRAWACCSWLLLSVVGCRLLLGADD